MVELAKAATDKEENNSMKKTTPLKTILVVGAHMDDAWYGVGGFTLQAVKNGHRVVFIQAVSDYSSWDVTKGREKTIDRRVHRIAEKRGIELRCLNYKYMHLLDDNELPAVLAQHVNDIRPDMLFVQWFDDTNRDHWKSGVAALYGGGHPGCFLGRAANKWIREIYAYEMDSQTQGFEPQVYSDVAKELPETLKALSEFDEIYAGYASSGHAKVLARVQDNLLKARFNLTGHSRHKYARATIRGAECHTNYAEAFYVYRGRPVQEMLRI